MSGSTVRDDGRIARAELERLLSAAPLDLPAGFLDAAERFVVLLLEANARTNLTRVVEPIEVARLHLLDALSALPILDRLGSTRALDLGTGGGVPGIVLAIARPRMTWTLVDSVTKKVTAVRAMLEALGLPNVTALSARAEDLGRANDHRESYDLVAARACAALPVLAEYALPLTRVGGSVMAWKGAGARDEVAAAGVAIDRLGGSAPTLVTAGWPELGERALVLIPKVVPTPWAYPRRPGMPSRRPLS